MKGTKSHEGRPETQTFVILRAPRGQCSSLFDAIFFLSSSP
jgi:hypothetical protein